MDNNGFTLVELIVVISLLALMGIMIGTNMVSVRSKQQQKNYDNYKKTIEDAACTYLETDGAYIHPSTSGSSKVTKSSCLSSRQNAISCYIYKTDLISEGYLDEDLQDPTGTRTGEMVAIYYVDGIKTCSYRG